MHLITLVLFLANADITVFTNANNLYNIGQYEASVQGYDSLISRGIENHIIYYNLGNCYFKLGNLGEAIYFYKKAQRLAPYDRDINFNLNFARARRADNVKGYQYPQFINMFVNFLGSLSINLLSIIAMVLYFGLAIFIALFFWYKKHFFGKSLKIWLGGVLLVVLIVLAVNIKRVNSPEGVLVESVSEVRSGPSEEYTLVFTIHEGMELKILEEQKGWFRIVLPDGLEGWLPAEKVKKI